MTSTIEGLIRRAGAQGVHIDGIKPTDTPGQGIGMIATRDLKKGDEIMNVPVRAIRSLHSVPKDISRKLPRDKSVHGSLAAEVALRNTASTEWARLVPQWEDFEATTPFLWHEDLQNLLPREAKTILGKQHTMFERDWHMFSSCFTDTSRQDYLYAWLLVNTRAFYYETSLTLKFPWHDRLALLPVADLFNHADIGCSVTFGTDSYTITADRRYRKGEEVYTSYGEHSNDYLFAEYGFLLKDNRWDKICLDDFVLPMLSQEQKSDLERHGYLDEFALFSGTTKTESIWIALRLLSSVKSDWQRYIDGEEDAEGTLAKAAELLKILLKKYLDSIKEIQRALQATQVGEEGQRKLLARRWEQIEALVKKLRAAK